jgi:hypothetical protein
VLRRGRLGGLESLEFGLQRRALVLERLQLRLPPLYLTCHRRRRRRGLGRRRRRLCAAVQHGHRRTRACSDDDAYGDADVEADVEADFEADVEADVEAGIGEWWSRGGVRLELLSAALLLEVCKA